MYWAFNSNTKWLRAVLVRIIGPSVVPPLSWSYTSAPPVQGMDRDSFIFSFTV
jgi:hypothetical protein